MIIFVSRLINKIDSDRLKECVQWLDCVCWRLRDHGQGVGSEEKSWLILRKWKTQLEENFIVVCGPHQIEQSLNSLMIWVNKVTN